MDADIKGTAILARLTFLDGQPGGRQAVLAKMDEADQKALQNVVPIGKYPLALKARLDRKIADVLRPRDRIGMFYELGRFAAKQNFELFHSSFVKERDPQGFMANAPAMRRLFYTDDNARYTKTSETSGNLVVTGAKFAEECDCYGTAGYWEVALGLAGAKNARVLHPQCIARGDAVCEYDLKWE